MKRGEWSRTIFEGDVYSSANYGDFKVIGYNNTNDIDIQFINTGTIVKTVSRKIKDGHIKDHYVKSVCGVACLGKYDKKLHSDRAYTTWYNMIANCYDDNRLYQHPHYSKCKVHDRWLCYANFLEDIIHLNGYNKWKNAKKREYCICRKSIYLINNIFSKDTCEFITTEERDALPKGKYISRIDSSKLFKGKDILLLNHYGVPG